MSGTPPLSDAQVRAVLEQRERLQEIADLRLTAPDIQALLQASCEQAAQEFQLPIGLVSIVLDEAQYFAARVGIPDWIEQAEGTPSEWSFCRYAVASQEPLIVDNAAQDERLKDNPLVTVDGLRCYAGVPLISSRGHALGSFCVAGVEARTFSDAELARLHELASEVMRQIEARRVRGPA
ncbi:MAG: GAF domain-containing protein [Gemmatimonadaceae bacterium]|nr:GAF domain-containing protein [Gemmatimonadaceae bacterium]